MFKIIAIETLDREKYVKTHPHPNDNETLYKQIMKILKPNQIYYFTSDYEIIDGRVIKKRNILNHDFFTSALNRPQESAKPMYFVSAIVGENGQGKSSLVELLMRMINNLAYVFQDALDKDYSEKLKFLYEIFARIYFETDNGQYYILEQTQHRIAYIDLQTRKKIWEYLGPDSKGFKSDMNSMKTSKEYLEELFYTIIINYSAYSFLPEDYPYLEQNVEYRGKKQYSACWFDTLFHKNDSYQTPIVLNPYRDYGIIDYRNEKNLFWERIYHLVLNEEMPVSHILNDKKVESFTFDIPGEEYNPIPGVWISNDQLNPYTSQIVYDAFINFRLIPEKVWKENKSQAEREAYSICRQIINTWNNVVGFPLQQTAASSIWEDMDLARAINYIIYKTIKIAHTYPRYYKYKNKPFEYVYIKKLYLNNDHITYKLHRCLAYIIFRFYGSGNIKNAYKENQTISIQAYNKYVREKLENQEYILNQLRNGSCFNNHLTVNKTWYIEELYPAPIFNTNVNMRNTLTGDKVSYDTMSSGEKHLLQSISTALYHVQNICSKWNNKESEEVRYNNICLVFDEAELYSHPNMQMKFITYLLNSLDGLNYNPEGGNSFIKSIHIIIATHSPFMLSDIPSSNVLCLNNGKYDDSSKVLGQSFAANVYDILSHKFFMDSFVGEFAKQKIETIIQKVSKAKKKNVNDLQEEIDLIGDEWVRNTLSIQLNKRLKKENIDA